MQLTGRELTGRSRQIRKWSFIPWRRVWRAARLVKNAKHRLRRRELRSRSLQARSRLAENFPVFCSNRHRRPLLARAMSRYVSRSALFDQGNRNERANYLDFAR